ncbi:hypothetical protein DFP92_10353 [Yoonia sediminilitoris]|uniref:Response regulatory domain-containing protein n=1 Tax=Yoonia sediminilitoris TaxID=1286148 RepID=A0A2T6KJQ6_9RHOB|nr:hypothetical protein C8N45_10353 [Yoonia sediminilitoris]RCW96549.1 hypothetical protein DFP92_10353 [Yoonia sediminilitoris]
MCICIIDDESISLSVNRAVLRLTEHEVEIFLSARDALDRCREVTL